MNKYLIKLKLHDAKAQFALTKRARGPRPRPLAKESHLNLQRSALLIVV